MKRRLMKPIIIAALFLNAAIAHGASIVIDGRTDYDARTSNEDNVNRGYPNHNRIYLQTARVHMKGNLSDAASYGFRFHLNRSFNDNALTVKDGVNNGIVDLAYFSYKFADMVTLSVGKGWAYANGFYALNSPPDRYLNPVVGVSTNWLGGASFGFLTGADLTFTFGDHEIRTQYFNEKNDSFAATGAPANSVGNYNGTRGGQGLVYRGNFMEKSLGIMASYHNWDASDSAATTKKAMTITTVGAKWTMDALSLSFDINNGTNKGYQATKDLSILGYALLVGYKMDSLKPILIASVEDEKSSDSTPGTTDVKTNYTKLGLALEYYPEAESNFRYHVAYTTQSEKADTTNALTYTENHVVAGVRFSADLLK